MSQLGQQRSHLASVLGGVKDYMTQYVFQQYTEVAGCGEVASRERISQFLSALKLWTAKPCRECQKKGRSATYSSIGRAARLGKTRFQAHLL